MSQNDQKSVLRQLREKKIFFEKTSSNMFSGNVIDLRKKIHANRMSFGVLEKIFLKCHFDRFSAPCDSKSKILAKISPR